MKAGAEAVVVGYPAIEDKHKETGEFVIRDRETVSPVLVSAVISSSFGEYFDDRPFFLIDAQTYYGMSGSPVLLWSNRFENQGELLNIHTPNPKDLLGIHSGRYALNEDLSLNRVWYSELIKDIVNTYNY